MLYEVKYFKIWIASYVGKFEMTKLYFIARKSRVFYKNKIGMALRIYIKV